MYREMEAFNQEVELSEDECCIVFDFGCYFPYVNTEVLTFDFSLGMEEFDDYKLNHRYINKGYQTISKKYGRRVSKIGYPYIMKLDQQSLMLLCVKIGLKGKYISLLFPILTLMTKENPVCQLTLHYNFDKDTFVLESCEPCKDGGWYQHRWTNEEFESGMGERDMLLNPVSANENNFTIIYQNVITPFPSTIGNLCLG